MLEKIKAFAESAKSILLFIIAPVTLLFGAIWYLLQKDKDLQAELATAKREQKLAEDERLIKESKDAADKATGDYQSIRDAYLKQHSDSGSED